MNLDSIKHIIEGDTSPSEEDIVLSIEYLLTNNRSVFLDQCVYDLSSERHNLLRRYMEKSIDIRKVGSLTSNYFLIPIVIHSQQSKEFAPLIENIDPNAISNIISNSKILKNEFSVSEVAIPKSTLFNTNFFGIFDMPRTLIESKDESYISHEQILSESDGQFVFYIVGSESGTRTIVNEEDWHEKMIFLESRLSRCSGATVSIMPPVKPSDERYESIFRDAWERLSNSLKFNTLHSINNVQLTIDSHKKIYSLMFFDCDSPVASMDININVDTDKNKLSLCFKDFVHRNNLGEGSISGCSDSHTLRVNQSSSSSSIKSGSMPRLKIIK